MYKKVEFEEFLLDKELAINTIDTYTRQMGVFFNNFQKFTKPNCLAYKKTLMESELSPKTINVKINAINRYSEFFLKEPFVIKGIKEHSKSFTTDVLTNADYDILMYFLKKEKLFKQKSMLQLLAYTGVRVSEATKIQKKHIIQGFIKTYSKGKARTILIPSKYLVENKEYFENLQDEDYVFFNSRTKKPLTTKGVDVVLKQLSEVCDVDRKRMHPHSFRHFFAINFLENGGDIALLADLLGHSNLSTTAIYTRLSQNQQSAKLESILNW